MSTAKQVKMRRGSTLENDLFTGAEGELTIDLTVGTARVHDGLKLGGNPLALADLTNIPADTDFEQRIMERIQDLIAAGGGTGGEGPMAIGDIKYTFVNPGEDFLPANGTLLNGADYPEIYEALGTKFGLDSSSPSGFAPNPSTTGTNNVTGLAQNGNTVVMTTRSGFYITSTDSGRTWSVIPDLNTNPLMGVAYGAGKFVSVGSGKISTSVDGITWTTSTTITSTFTNVVFLKDRFIAFALVAQGGSYTSTDGVNWTTTTINGFTTAAPLTWYYASNQNVFLAGGASAALASSVDGVTWTSRTSNMTNNINGFMNNGSTIVAVGGQVYSVANIATSPDGFTWTARTNSIGSIRYSGFWWAAKSLFITTGNLGVISTSPDGVTWTSLTSAQSGNLTTNYIAGQHGSNIALAADGVTVVNCGQNSWSTSTDGITWTRRASRVVASYISTMVNRIAVVGSNTLMWGSAGMVYSEDNMTNGYWFWSTTDTTVVPNMRAWAVKDGVAVAQGTSYTIASDGDFADVAGPMPTLVADANGSRPVIGVGVTNRVNNIQIINNKFVAWGLYGNLTSSVDGYTWTPSLVFPSSVNVTKVAFGAGKYVAVNDSGGVATSSNAIAWNAVASHPMTGVSINDVKWLDSVNKFLAVGANGKMMTSVDGSTWVDISITNQTTTNLNRIVVTDSLVGVIGATRFCVSSLTDLASWIINIPPVLSSISAGPSLFVAAGSGTVTANSVTTNFPVVYTSLDGITWATQQLDVVGGSTRNLKVYWTGQGYLAIGQYAGISPCFYTSPNGLNWSTRLVNNTNAVVDIGWNAGERFIVSSTQNNALALSFALVPDGKFRLPIVRSEHAYDPDPYIKVK